MVFAVQAFLAFRNTARRDTISNTIQTRIAGVGTFGELERSDATSAAGDPAVALAIRFLTRAEADQFWTDVQAFVGTGVNGPVTGSYLSRHDCPHDQATRAPCAESGRVNY